MRYLSFIYAISHIIVFLHSKGEGMLRNKRAFTLAEVLITLAIIGIVAVIVIPTLISNQNEKTWKTSSEVFKNRLHEAMLIMNSQGVLAGYSTTKDFVNELAKNMNTVKICQDDDLFSCFESEIMWQDKELDLASSETFASNERNTGLVGIQFANGTTALVEYNPKCKQNPFSNQVDTESCISMLYDTSGFKLPNENGKDLRSINIDKFNRLPAHIIDGVGFGNGFRAYVSQSECMEMKNDPKYSSYMKYDCGVENDYFAGTLKRCIDEGMKLPTQAQLAKLAKYIYNDDGTLNSNKVQELGLPTGGFYVIANNEVSATRVQTWDMYANKNEFSSSYRYNQANAGICVAN